MTVPNACLVFLLAFSGVTGWLLLREPAQITVTEGGDAAGDQVFGQTLPDADADPPPAASLASHRSTLRNVLENTGIPVLDLNDATLGEAVEFLRLYARELGSASTLDFSLEHPPAGQTSAGHDSDSLINIYKENISFADALDLICNETDHHWEIDEHRVLIRPN